MNTLKISALAVALAFSAGAFGAAESAMTRDQYKAAKDRIEADYKVAKDKCDAMSRNEKDVCVAEAKGREKVAKAELDAEYKPSDKARRDVEIAKAEAEYAVAREKCDAMSGEQKNACVKEARAVEAQAKADARMAMKSREGKVSASDRSNDMTITSKVKEKLAADSALKANDISVTTEGGVVELKGFVGSKEAADRAAEAARSVSGVTSVKNELKVKAEE